MSEELIQRNLVEAPEKNGRLEFLQYRCNNIEGAERRKDHPRS